MSEGKLCIDCKYCVISKSGFLGRKTNYYCSHPEVVNQVHGAYKECSDQRFWTSDSDNKCGRQGKLFEEKEGDT